MQLYLVQHGAAKSETEDPRRSLTDEGKRTVEQMADHLGLLGLSLDRIEHSDKLRARQTAEILAARLQPRAGSQEVAGMAPNDDINPMRDRLQVESTDVMLVGHLPYLSRLVARLLRMEEYQNVVEFGMGGVVRLDRDLSGEWAVRWAITPELLLSPSSKKWHAA